jgi:hypothetical protein
MLARAGLKQIIVSETLSMEDVAHFYPLENPDVFNDELP